MDRVPLPAPSMNSPLRPCVILFAKAPIAGHVKTRLARAIGAEAALALHRAFVLDMLDKLSNLCGLADIEIHTDMETNAWLRPDIAVRLQTSGDLGSKMYHALGTALAEGRQQACIVGSDAPTLPISHLASLLASPAEVALGPCEDGGYYAIACRRVQPGMFRGVEWSSHQALEQTREAALSCGLDVECGPLWFDVDNPEELTRLMRERELPNHTNHWFKTWGALQPEARGK